MNQGTGNCAGRKGTGPLNARGPVPFRPADRCPAAGAALGFLVSLLLFPAGCQNCDHVEAELRTRENEVRALRAELYHAVAVNQSLQHELHAAHHSSAAKINSEPAVATDPVTEVVLGWQTGSTASRSSGDDALQVVVEPRDADGRAVTAAAGSLQISVLEIAPGGRKSRLCSWDVSAEQLRRSWRKGLMSTGYYLVLPWKNRPTSDKVRVVVDLTTADGRVLEADKDVTVRSPSPSKRKAAPAEPETPLPLPRKVDDSSKSSRRTPPSQSSAIEPASMHSERANAPLSESIRMDRPVPLDPFPIAKQP